MTRILLLSFLWIFSIKVIAQTGAVKGHVAAGTTPVAFANIWLADTDFGEASDESGNFQIQNIPPGIYHIRVTALGYTPWQEEITVAADSTLLLGAIPLEDNALGLTEVVVTGTFRETFVGASPVKVNVVTSRFLERNGSPSNLVESIKLVNGLQEVVACGVCNTNSISINGMSGAYTAVLVDGVPLYGNLASVYGLNGIPRLMIDRMEVVRGPGATLYGSEAMAGVINILTKDPAKQPLVAFDLMGASNGETTVSTAFTPALAHSNGSLGADLAMFHNYTDHNGDGFGDMALYDRLSLFGKWSRTFKSDKKLTLFGKYYWEDRRNGVAAFAKGDAYKNLRGSDGIYGESIYTHRGELFGRWDLPTTLPLRWDFAASWHDQNSYYGNAAYQATQGIAFSQLTWVRQIGKHQLLAGQTLRYQYYDDNTVATLGQPEKQVIAGLLAQDEWQLSPAFTALAGMRIDYFKLHGLIPSPRLNVKYKPYEWTTLRLNFGTGFRVVNLFTEDHAFITGQRQVLITEALRPERSWNLSLNANHVFAWGPGQGSIDVDAFYTYFTNKIIPDYSQPGWIVYSNTQGHALSKGLGMQLNYQWKRPFTLNLGVTRQWVTRTEPNGSDGLLTSPIEFAPQWSGVGALNYTWKKQELTVALTTNVTGPMALPKVYDFNDAGELETQPRPVQSKSFVIQNVQVIKEIESIHLDVYAGVRNLWNYRQPYSPLSGYNDPATAPGFSPSFDTSYAYGPMQGRIFYVGVRMTHK